MKIVWLNFMLVFFLCMGYVMDVSICIYSCIFIFVFLGGI